MLFVAYLCPSQSLKALCWNLSTCGSNKIITMSSKTSDREDRNVSYNLHKMTTDIIFGHGRALQFERYITCKSIDVHGSIHKHTSTPRRTCLPQNVESRSPGARGGSGDGERRGEVRRGEVYLQTLSIATGWANRSQENILHG